MKTIYKSKLIVGLVVLSLLVSCSEDFLIEVPRLSQSNELMLSTYQGLQSATVGTYGHLPHENWYGVGFLVVADMKGGNAKRGPVSSGRYIPEYLWINNASSTSNLWTTAYSTIARANNVINAIDDGFEETGVTQAQLDQLKGENLFLRALSHWDLVRLYAQPYVSGRDNPGVPVVLLTQNAYPSRNSVGDVYDQVVEDLILAESLLGATNPRGADNSWATKKAASALLAKVYLYMGNWQGAADKATEVMAGMSLFPATQYTVWNDSVNPGFWGSGGVGSEIIFQVDGTETNTSHGYWMSISFLVDPEGYGDVATSHDLLDLYEAGDVRRDLFLEPDEYPGEFWTLKYPGRLGRTPKREFNVPVLRLAEMYLIRAEAILNGASVTGVTALADYNAIRANRGLTAAGSVSLPDIYDERRRELNFEGNQLFDLARTSRSLVRVDYDGAENQNITFVQGGSVEDNYLWAMPIPQAEIDANDNMEQNFGY